ncbi:MAG: OmpA family protein [Bacteroidales bacterium]|nr:OmpA family protein [Bacteroidales bacterium]MBQ9186120.1 OmpA family protein [Bacteroidales bacterium]
MKKFIAFALCGLIILSGCDVLNNYTKKGAAIGAGGGAAAGAGIGALIGKDGKSAAIGAAIGAIIGAGTGTLIGNKMDKKAEELAALENAKVETIKDANGLTAIKVTFDSGILFATGKSDLNNLSKTQLQNFVSKMKDMPDTDLAVFGHTDNTGSAAVNEKLSVDRAMSVANYLQACGMAASRMTVDGFSYTQPVASNDTAEGRAQNRRVEIYIYANEDMIKAAEAAQN